MAALKVFSLGLVVCASALRLGEEGMMNQTNDAHQEAGPGPTTGMVEWDEDACAEWEDDECVAHFEGKTCDAMASHTITSVQTWCGKLRIPIRAFHCLAVAQLSAGGNQGFVLIELESSSEKLGMDAPLKRGQKAAQIRCVPMRHAATKESVTDDSMIAMTQVAIENPPKPSVAKLPSRNLAVPTNGIHTLGDLKTWSEQYARAHPAYSMMTTNCQHFSTAMYNAVTGSATVEKQFYSHALSKRPFRWMKEQLIGSA